MVGEAITKDARPPLRTLTLLFTDIEGSTQLWDARAEAMRAAMERHNALLRTAITERGGQVFRVVGDGFCSAFPDAASAVEAAVAAQRTLTAERWNETPIRVRMGLHSGAVEASEDDVYRGPSLARAARVTSAAHGGQILVSASTVALLGEQLPSGSSLRDLGDHTLRGFARLDRLYQLIVPGLESEFPPIRTREALRTNLQPALTSFIGREAELAAVREKVRHSRMVTLTGPGGTGKTRLALSAAGELVDAFPDGIWLIELAPLADPTLIAQTMATVLGARAEGNVNPLTIVQDALRDQQALLVIDNCEHVVDQAADIAQRLLQALPLLHLLTTSREALGAEGEIVHRVASLTTPAGELHSTVAVVAASEAGRLFVERARAVVPDFVLGEGNADAVAQICRRLDGIPLAIELAAARMKMLSAGELAGRLDDRFRLLTGGRRTALPRQRTLRALVDWSYELLSADERSVLMALSTFSGGFALRAAQAVCALGAHGEIDVLDAIERLADKSLVIADHDEGVETRCRLLETMRQYAAEKLAEGGRADAARRRHFEYFLGLAERAEPDLRGPVALEWLDRLETDHDNFRAALEWANDVDAAGCLRLAGALWRFWDTHGHFLEARHWLERALAAHAIPDRARLKALIGAGFFAYRFDDHPRCLQWLEEAIALARQFGDLRSEAEAKLYRGLPVPTTDMGDEALLEEARAMWRSLGDPWGEGYATLWLGQQKMRNSDTASAQRLYRDSVALFRHAGCASDAALALTHSANCSATVLDFASARRDLDEALAGHRRMGNVHDAATALRTLGWIDLNEGRIDEARRQAEESVTAFEHLHDGGCARKSSAVLATVLCALGDSATALRYMEDAASWARRLGHSFGLARAQLVAGRIHAAQGDGDLARRSLAEAMQAQTRTTQYEHLPSLLEAIAGTLPGAAAAPRLLGAAAVLRETLHRPMFPAERGDFERWLAAVCAAHSAVAYGTEFAAGRRLTRAEAIRCALALVAPDAIGVAS